MDLIDYIFLPVLGAILFLAVFDDLKQKLIKNTYVSFGFIWATTAYMLLFFLAQLNGEVFATKFVGISFSAVAINFIVALIVGFLLWKFSVWGAGDGKFFAVLSLMLPLKYYYNGYFPVFPSFALLINIFFIALVVVLAEVAYFYALRIGYIRQLKFAKITRSSLSKAVLEPIIMTLNSIAFTYFMRVVLMSFNDSLGKKLTVPMTLLSVFFVFYAKKRNEFLKSKLWIICGLGIVAAFIMVRLYLSPKAALNEISLIVWLNVMFMFGFGIFGALIQKYNSFSNGKVKKVIPFAAYMFCGVILTMIIRAPITSWIAAHF